MAWNLCFQASLWSHLSFKVNGVVVRRLDQILWSQTQANGDFWKFMLAEHSSIDHLKLRKSSKKWNFCFFERCRERKFVLDDFQCFHRIRHIKVDLELTGFVCKPNRTKKKKSLFQKTSTWANLFISALYFWIWKKNL